MHLHPESIRLVPLEVNRLPIGLALARVLTDKRWRYCS